MLAARHAQRAAVPCWQHLMLSVPLFHPGCTSCPTCRCSILATGRCGPHPGLLGVGTRAPTVCGTSAAAAAGRGRRQLRHGKARAVQRFYPGMQAWGRNQVHGSGADLAQLNEARHNVVGGAVWRSLPPQWGRQHAHTAAVFLRQQCAANGCLGCPGDGVASGIIGKVSKAKQAWRSCPAVVTGISCVGCEAAGTCSAGGWQAHASIHPCMCSGANCARACHLLSPPHVAHFRQRTDFPGAGGNLRQFHGRNAPKVWLPQWRHLPPGAPLHPVLCMQGAPSWHGHHGACLREQ